MPLLVEPSWLSCDAAVACCAQHCAQLAHGKARLVHATPHMQPLLLLAPTHALRVLLPPLQGLVTVRAFRQQEPFQQRSTQLLDASNRAWWPAQVSRGLVTAAAYPNGRAESSSSAGKQTLPGISSGNRQSHLMAATSTTNPPTHPLRHLQCINRWLSVRLEMLGITVVFLTALLVGVALPRDAGLAGLAITSALNLTG